MCVCGGVGEGGGHTFIAGLRLRAAVRLRLLQSPRLTEGTLTAGKTDAKASRCHLAEQQGGEANHRSLIDV